MYGPSDKDVKFFAHTVLVAALLAGLAAFGLGAWLF